MTFAMLLTMAMLVGVNVGIAFERGINHKDYTSAAKGAIICFSVLIICFTLYIIFGGI